MSVDIVTFGCRLNTYELEVMRRETEAAGLGELDGGAIVFNTCAVTGEAVRQARQAIRKARRENPEARIVVTGCAAQTEPASFGEMEEVDLVIGNDDKLKAQSYRALPEFGINQFEKVRVNDIFEVTETASHMVDAIEGRARAFVQVQNGCDHRCTFCIIPYGRGNSRSVPMGAVVEQVKRLAGNGYREVVLTGVDLTSYGPDLPGSPKLGKLVRTILRQVPDLDRLRLSSIDSIEADDDLMEAIATEQRLMPHFHLSLQHGDNLILKRMKRRHAREDSIAFCEDVRRLRPDAAFGADIIAGFPTETEAHFENSLRDRRRVRPRPCPRLPVLAARGHAGGAHAASGARDRQATGEAPARKGRRRLGAPYAASRRHPSASADRTRRHRPHRGFLAGQRCRSGRRPRQHRAGRD